MQMFPSYSMPMLLQLSSAQEYKDSSDKALQNLPAAKGEQAVEKIFIRDT